jgi:hypothetical protein
MVARVRRGAHGQYSPFARPPAAARHDVVPLDGTGKWGRRPILIAGRETHAGRVPRDIASRHSDEEQHR